MSRSYSSLPGKGENIILTGVAIVVVVLCTLWGYAACTNACRCKDAGGLWIEQRDWRGGMCVRGERIEP